MSYIIVLSLKTQGDKYIDIIPHWGPTTKIKISYQENNTYDT